MVAAPPPPAAQRVDPEQFNKIFGAQWIDLISSSLAGTIHSFSDEFFANAANLINPRPPVHKPAVFVPTGAWYDGWETRRHNPDPADWVIVKLGVPSGRLYAFEVDTAFFNGNHAPAVTVEAAYINPGEEPDTYHHYHHHHHHHHPPWEMVLPMQECGPNQRHIWLLPTLSGKPYTHLRLSQYPDGGIARFRAYGVPVPVWPDDPDSIVDLAYVANAGIVTSFSDSHYGAASNILLPGRGINMGDGWETKRSRVPGHTDWVVVRLGAPGRIEQVVVDTMHFRGNYPKEVFVQGLDWRGKDGDPSGDDEGWSDLVLPEKCVADKEHAFPSTKLVGVQSGEVYTHVKMTIVPDGGVKRLRVWGKRVVE